MNPLIICGSQVKLRLMAERVASKSVVHVDWVRFTTQRRNAPVPSVDNLFPLPEKFDSVWDPNHRANAWRRILATLPDCDLGVSIEAHELADEVAKALGPDFVVSTEVKKGMDFYKFRWSIELNGCECAWVGFLASSDSPRQQSQSKTIHANLFGTACTFAALGWNHRIADIVDSREGELTRADLALDFFDGIEGGIDGVRADYRAGLCNVGGRRLKFNLVGDWENGHDRSVYIGSREAGKITNIYEKGDQLFGEKSNSEWLRFELRYGNKLRYLSSDLLRRPADFFAGASDWHLSILSKADAIVTPESVPCAPRLPALTVLAECTRNVRWMIDTAASSFGVACKYLTESQLFELVENKKLPGRLEKFSKSQISDSFSDAFRRLTSVGGCPSTA